MIIEENKVKRIVTVWLTQEESKGKRDLQERLLAWKQEGYFPVIFHSGREDLYEQTKSLLLYNRCDNA